jgi:CPA2 family monovalent cation:H+ antiporter-2
VNETARLLIEAGAVLFVLGVLGRLAGSIGLSPIPFYLLAGLAFGTGGIIALDAPAEFFAVGSQVGVVLLLLVLGLEYTSDELVTSLRRQAPVGVVDLMVNGLPGAVFAWLAGWGPVAAFAMFGVTAVSSSGIVSKLLTDLGRLGNRETPSVLGVLVLEDLAMAIHLPVLVALLAATGFVDGAVGVTVALVTLAVVLVIALRHSATITRFVGARSDEVLLLRVTGLALLVAGVAEAVHVSAAVGAFLLGIALSGEVAHQVRGLLGPLRDLFAAVFFVFFGLSTDPGPLPDALLPAGLLALVGIGTKLVTGWIAGRRSGVGSAGRLRAGATLVPRGEFSIIIAGLAAGSVNPAFAPTVAAYVLILAVVGPLMPRLTDPLARRLARRAAAPDRPAGA